MPLKKVRPFTALTELFNPLRLCDYCDRPAIAQDDDGSLACLLHIHALSNMAILFPTDKPYTTKRKEN